MANVDLPSLVKLNNSKHTLENSCCQLEELEALRGRADLQTPCMV